ncbi:NPL4 family-domain-containing protein [Halteromyces radiatus]|uniref:NPL4 family-domain-containing protein n=1 Tax=Halteromyces radiatus TaxID=101107 RepID=UPI00221E9786|nr:NPL4 family-domain-containing protein [Halteromyces radiatus]KAI8093238.1 NPL4 family-domain-containing protein [Halteromyces radiatus]
MLLRIRSKEGMARVQVEPQETFGSLAAKIAQLHNVDASTIAISNKQNTADATPIGQLQNNSLSSANLKHGDIVYVTYTDPEDNKPADIQPPVPDINGNISMDKLAHTKQDPVDDFLEKQRGLIKRSKDPKFCRHGDNAMCDYCMPLEPYDKGYLEENKIKHMSFHSYLRHINSAQQTKAPSSAILTQLPPLEEPSYKVKVPCTGGHASWPEGICTKCQPSAITLQRQTYRVVDHVEFSSASLIDNFLNYWRQTGNQRIGYLYGRYEPYLEVPLGIKAVVEAIYEPPQENHVDGLKLSIPWQEEVLIDDVAHACGLSKVGVVFTDLIDDGSGSGKVVTKRHVDSHFLSSLECSFAAEMQLAHPNVSRHAVTGKYGSKFVTCVISGDLEGNIGVSAYQVSDTMTAMHDAGIVEPSRNPSVVRVKESIPHQRYVPEVFYKFKNEYGVMVQESAKPTFPVEYLLVNVTNGFPQKPSPLFTDSRDLTAEGVSHPDIGTLGKHLLRGKSKDDLQALLSDFHVLCAIRSMDMLSREEFKIVCDIATKASDINIDILDQLQGWQTLLMVLKEAEGNARINTPSIQSRSGSGTNTPSETIVTEISCKHCTFTNPGSNNNCEMCGLPLSD